MFSADQQKERETELMKPTLHAMTGQPDTAAGALKKLEGSYKEPSTASYYARKMTGVRGRPRCL